MAIETAAGDVRERAYALWEAKGSPHGTTEEDWLTAEAQIRADLDAVSPLEPLASEAAEALDSTPGGDPH